MKMKKIVMMTGILCGCALSIAACSSKPKAEMEAGEVLNTGEMQEDPEKMNLSEMQGETSAEGGLTLGEAADFMIETAAQYGNRVEKETLLKELEDRAESEADRLDMLVVVSRAFGTLPEPEESKKQKEDTDISSIPEWALKDVENLKNAGALKKSDLENIEDPVIKSDVEAMVQRVMDLYGN